MCCWLLDVIPDQDGARQAFRDALPRLLLYKCMAIARAPCAQDDPYVPGGMLVFRAEQAPDDPDKKIARQEWLLFKDVVSQTMQMFPKGVGIKQFAQVCSLCTGTVCTGWRCKGWSRPRAGVVYGGRGSKSFGGSWVWFRR